MSGSASNKDDNNKGSGKLTFSLALNKNKKKIKTVLGASADFQNDDEKREKQTHERTAPLVIPLQASHKMTLLERKIAKSQDELAAEALTQSAESHFAGKETTKNGTNFSAQGNLVISSGDNTNLVAASAATTRLSESNKDKQQYQKELEALPDEADSEAYDRVPIGEFGAALLRGMGWTGGDSSSAGPAPPAMRPHRLGLGATPKLPPPTSTSGKIRTADQVKRDERLQKQHAGFEEQRLQRMRQDKQQTMQIGSLVTIESQQRNTRAKLLKLSGVPGLNRVLVQIEGERTPTSIKKGDILALIARSDLEKMPFRDVAASLEKDMKAKSTGDEKQRDSEDRRNRDGDDRQRRRDGKHHRDDRRPSDDDRAAADNKKRKRREESRNISEDSWLISNIRVRVITKKLGSNQYKEKGVVVDVTTRGEATLQMANGKLLDRVPERYLETALPKVGGNAIVLVGKSKFAKGKLLERDSRSGKGIIQVFEDMNVLKLSLDDMAEWVGPLDDDMME
jgi:G patch domain/KOW motif-containing protein